MIIFLKNKENSEKIKKLLKSDFLKKDIKKIDNAKSAYKFKVFNQTVKENPELNDFISVMLSEMDYLDSEGRFKSNE